MSRADIVIRRDLPSPYPGQKRFHRALDFVGMAEEDQVAGSRNRDEARALELAGDVRALRPGNARCYVQRPLKCGSPFGISSCPLPHMRRLVMNGVGCGKYEHRWRFHPVEGSRAAGSY